MPSKKAFMDWSALIKDISESSNITLGMTDLVNATGVPASQLRYWIQKKYIIPVSAETDKRKTFKYNTIFRVRAIKYFLDAGFKLSGAIENVDAFRDLDVQIQRAIVTHIQAINVDDETGAINIALGGIGSQQELILTLQDGNSVLTVRKTDIK